jgi:hypothetical protein
MEKRVNERERERERERVFVSCISPAIDKRPFMNTQPTMKPI